MPPSRPGDQRRWVAIFAGALAATALLVVLVGAPDRDGPDATRAVASRGVADDATSVRLTVEDLDRWCDTTFDGATATRIGDNWECTRTIGGFFRHDPVRDEPCQAQFGLASSSTVEDDQGIRCTPG